MFGIRRSVPSVDERAAVLALVAVSKKEWHRTAGLIEQARSALALARGEWTSFDPADAELATSLLDANPAALLPKFRALVDDLNRAGVQVVTVLDPEYPVNLRAIFNRPPMLFIRGSLLPRDERAVAVVGTRNASPEGLQQAHRLAAALAKRGVTVLSGLARGIDSAAHRGALAANGRTVAVMGTGIDRVYPRENQTLAEEIVTDGALVSQFWPGSPPTRSSFPMRNVVMSGLSVGTAVVEASATSGARLQARLALEHGKRVFLVKSLVLQQAWARSYSTRPGVTVVSSVDEIVDIVDDEESPPQQLSFG